MKQILNILSYVGIALVFGALAVRWTKPEWAQYAIYATYVGLALVVLYTIGQWREIVTFFGRRSARYGALATVSLVVVLGILVAANYLSYRRNQRWDLTANQFNSLSEQSQKVLSGLDAPMKLTVFDQRLNFDRYREQLDQYSQTSRQVTVEYVDAAQDPVRTRKYEVQALPTLIVEHKDRTEKVITLDERGVTGAIIRVVTGQQRKLYFVQGHGEHDPTGMDESGYSEVVQYLSADNIAVEPLNLTQKAEIPADATMLAIAGPTTDFLDPEIEAVKKYLAGGGRMLMLLDPTIDEKAQPMPKLTALAREWGVEFGSNVVLDLSGRSESATVVVASPPYPAHPITERFRVFTVFPLAQSVKAVASPPPDRTVQPIVETSQASWAETDIAGLRAGGGQPEMNADKGDLSGPVPLAVAVSTPAPPEDPAQKPAEGAPPTPPQTRLVLVGDADFASNAAARSGGNVNLFVNAINWLSAQENLIAIRPREAGDSRLTITALQARAVWWLSVLVVPAVVFGAGIIAWRRRR
jgi:ABC-type uncharacterized transport system involved in gliding motility auxiliary subunit